jgi:aspartate kinase
MKFGGTSVGDVERIARVARIVAAERQNWRGLAVVVSAMSGETDRLVKLARGAAGLDGNGGPGLTGREFDDEYDVIVSTGEQVTTGLLALALRRIGVPARSWQYWQIPFRTDRAQAKARIAEIEQARIGESIDDGVVAIVPGFQGVTPDERVTTLGRGGSDTSAVALAADGCQTIQNTFGGESVVSMKRRNKIWGYGGIGNEHTGYIFQHFTALTKKIQCDHFPMRANLIG